MSLPPPISSKELVNALKRDGFRKGKSKSGSHQVYIKEEPGRKIVVTAVLGKKEIPRPTLKSILKRAEISEEEFQTLLKGKR